MSIIRRREGLLLTAGQYMRAHDDGMTMGPQEIRVLLDKLNAKDMTAIRTMCERFRVPYRTYGKTERFHREKVMANLEAMREMFAKRADRFRRGRAHAAKVRLAARAPQSLAVSAIPCC